MFTQLDGKIGTREFFSIILLTLTVKITDSTPTLYLTIGKNAGWMVALVAASCTLIPLLLLLKLLNKYQKGMLDIMYTLLGKHIAKFFAFITFLSIEVSAAINSRNYVDITQSLYLPRTPRLVVYSILIGGACIIAYLGIEAIGRVAWIVAPYITIVLFIALIAAWKDMRFDFLFPIFGSGVKPIILRGAANSALFSEAIWVAIIYDNVRGYKEYKLANLLGFSLSVLEICIFLIVYIAVFDYPPVIIINFLYQSLVRLINIGRFFSNIDAVYLIFWVFSSIIRLAAQVYVGAVCLAFSLKLTNIKKLLLPMAILAIVIGSIPENSYTVLNVRKMIIVATTVLFDSAPFILFIASKIKENKVQNCE